MQDTLKSETDLEIALKKLCESLPEGAIADKEKAVSLVKQALIETFGDSKNVPLDLFADPAKRQNLVIGLVTAPIKDLIPSLDFDLKLFFKAELKPEESKKLFKAFLVGLNQLEPNPAKRLSDDKIAKEAEDLLNKYEAVKAKKEVKSSAPTNNTAFDEIDEMCQVIFGYNRFGVPVALTVDKGNLAGIVDTAPSLGLKHGSISHGSGIGGDSTTDPYVFAMAQERILDMGTLSVDTLKNLKASGIIHATPTLAPGTGH